jgi:hypothetical protein
VVRLGAAGPKRGQNTTISKLSTEEPPGEAGSGAASIFTYVRMICPSLNAETQREL